MRVLSTTTLLVFVLISFSFSQDSSRVPKPPSSKTSDVEMAAITNLRKFAAGEAEYAMSHPQEGFACDPQVLTKLEWPASPTHSKLLDPALLTGSGKYKFSARCAGNAKPSGELSIFAVPVDRSAGLRTFCATGTFGPFEERPYVSTSEFPIRSVSKGTPESCLASGEPLK